MGDHQNLELNRAVDPVADGKSNSLSSCILERTTPFQFAPDQNSCLVEKGILPPIGFSSPADVCTATSSIFETPHLPRCEAPTHEKRGPVDVSIDEYGEMVEVKDNHGYTYSKTADGKWTRHHEGDNSKNDDVVENVKADSKGTVSYDYNDNERNVHVHHERYADGSWSYVNEFGKFVYDKDMQLVEAPAGEGHSRKFHYTNGQLDQIDGRLGHWDRVEKDGQVSWVNKDSGAVWQGDFKLNLDLLEYRGQNGVAWGFTAWGTDVNEAAENKKGS